MTNGKRYGWMHVCAFLVLASQHADAQTAEHRLQEYPVTAVFHVPARTTPSPGIVPPPTNRPC